MEDGLSGNGVDTLHGTARFTGTNTIAIDGTSYEAAHFLVAAGARPRPLDVPGHEHLVDSTGFMHLQALPPRTLFVGGGFISFEFAHIAARAGSTPVIVDHGPRPLKAFDPDLVELLISRGADVGIELWRSTTITGIERSETGYQVTVERSIRPIRDRRVRPCRARCGPGIRTLRPRPRRRRGGVGRTRGARGRSPAEHHQPGGLRGRRRSIPTATA
jgi:glutathione reductase (NADPH)